MPASIELERRLRWADADAAGRLHFPRIFEIIEEAESELVRGIAWPMNRSMGYDFPRVHVECRFLRVLMLDSHGLPGSSVRRGVLPRAGLDAGLLVGADHELVRSQPAALPESVVEVEDSPGLLLEVRIAGEDPASVLPGSDRVFAEPSPDGGVADGRHQAGAAHV